MKDMKYKSAATSADEGRGELNYAEFLATPRGYITKWVTVNNVKISPQGEPLHHLGWNQVQLQDKIFLDYGEQLRTYNSQENSVKMPKLTESELTKAFCEYIAYEIVKHKDNAINNVRFCGVESTSHIETYLQAILDRPPTAVEIAVIQQFIWQVKRRMTKKDVIHQIMPILYSPLQGVGKSRAVDLLVSPVKHYCIETSISDMSDQRYYFKFQDAFVGLVNEMQGCARADIESIKRVITADFLDVRKLGTNLVIKVRQNCNFIGTSNRHLVELLVDSGMRRYFQYEVSKNLNRDVVNSVDYVALWQSVDENRERGYTENVIDELTNTQQEYSQEDYHKTFIKDCDLEMPEHEFSFMKFSDVYETYREWCTKTGNKSVTLSWLGNKLRSCGQKVEVHKDESGKTTRYIKVKPDTKLPTSIPKGFSKVNNRRLEIL